MNLGYACINTQLKEEGIFTNRTCRKKTFEEKGLAYIDQLALQNVKDLLRIIEWNEANGIKLFRISSQVFPWMEFYEWDALPSIGEIRDLMLRGGEKASQFSQRLTMHPGPYHCLASPSPKVVERTIRGLEKHSEQFDMMGYDPSPYNKINIHVGGAYGNKEETLERFSENFRLLSPSLQKRLVLENDDSPNEFSLKDLHEGVWKKISIPLTFDYFHHKFNTGGLTEEEALKLAASTWPENIRQCCHYSESRRKEKLDETIRPQAHSDIIYEEIQTYGLEPDVVIEAKLKEQAIKMYVH
jgi:UV DNA damage endonuclease